MLVGIDGAGPGWIAAMRDAASGAVSVTGIAGGRMAEFLRTLPARSVVAIDIPMGLGDATEEGGRACERACRAFLGAGRASSVFSTPSRAVVMAADYPSACLLVRIELPGRKGVSKQAWNIFPKIREADAARQQAKRITVRESHPEAVFATMNGDTALREGKITPEGHALRRKLLKREGFDVTRFLDSRPAGCKRDDLVDAFACLWAAQRIASGAARVFGDAKSGIWA